MSDATVKLIATGVLSALVAGIIGMAFAGPRASQSEDLTNINNLPRLKENVKIVKSDLASLERKYLKHVSDIQHTDTLQCVHISNVEAAVNSLMTQNELPATIKLISCGSGAGK